MSVPDSMQTERDWGTSTSAEDLTETYRLHCSQILLYSELKKMSFLVTARVIFQTLFPRTLGDPAELLYRLSTEETREKVGIFFLLGV